MEGHLPPAAQEKYQEMQALQDEATDVVSEKERAERRLEESKTALEALDGADDELVYRRIGKLRVRTTAADIGPEIERRVDDLESRIEELAERKQRLEERFENRKEDIRHLLGGGAGPGTHSE